MPNQFWCATLLALLAALVAGCEDGSGPGVRSLPQNAVRLEDDLGRVIEIEQPVRRVVAFSPGGLRLLEGVEARDVAAAVGPRVARGEEELARLSALGQAQMVDADLILADRLDYEDWVRSSSGPISTPILVFDPQDLEGVTHDLELVGLAVDRGAEGRAAVAGMRQRLERVARALKGAASVKGYWLSEGESPPPWLDELAHRAGGEWVGGSEQGLVAGENSFDILVFFTRSRGTEDGALSRVRQDPWGAVFLVPGDLALVPGPQLALGVEVLAHHFHPDRLPLPQE